MPSMAECVARAAERLAHGPHPERARQDAETLVRSVLGKDKSWLIAHADDELPGGAVGSLAERIERRSFGEPIQYILGETEFYGLPFRLTRDVLIPRPETELVVERALELGSGFSKPRIVDVGAGSGAIAVALARNVPQAAIAATDTSAAALQVARVNAKRNGVLERVRFLEGDLLEPVAGERIDQVVSNPPYVAESDRGSLAVEVRDFEPAQALFAGEDGLAVYRRLIPAAHAALAAGGWVVLEIGCGQEASVRALLNGAGFEAIEFAADLRGIARVASARRP
jgi:release factor glutamine methyltransferase